MNPKLLPEEAQRILATLGETDIAEARKILGKAAEEMTDEEVKNQIACIQCLADSWLDEYERKIFKGKTLNEKLAETPY